ncbi:MAG: hypothetical protein N2235_01420 [Fischerella sp.]|nr:hypothetical protein [Fischerella sp.]
MKFDQIISWTATAVIVIGVVFNAFDIQYQKHIFFFGCLLWVWAGLLWRQPSLWVLNSITAAIYLAGWIL